MILKGITLSAISQKQHVISLICGVLKTKKKNKKKTNIFIDEENRLVFDRGGIGKAN